MAKAKGKRVVNVNLISDSEDDSESDVDIEIIESRSLAQIKDQDKVNKPDITKTKITDYFPSEKSSKNAKLVSDKSTNTSPKKDEPEIIAQKTNTRKIEVINVEDETKESSQSEIIIVKSVPNGNQKEKPSDKNEPSAITISDDEEDVIFIERESQKVTEDQNESLINMKILNVVSLKIKQSQESGVSGENENDIHVQDTQLICDNENDDDNISVLIVEEIKKMPKVLPVLPFTTPNSTSSSTITTAIPASSSSPDLLPPPPALPSPNTISNLPSSSPQPPNSENTEKQNEPKNNEKAENKKTENLLEKKNEKAGRSKIAFFEEIEKRVTDLNYDEMDFDDPDFDDKNSAYLRQDKLMKSYVRKFNNICERKKWSKKTNRPIFKKVDLSTASKQAKINKAAEEFVNEMESLLDPPDFNDFLEIAQKTNKKEKLSFSEKEILNISEEIFHKFMSQLKVRKLNEFKVVVKYEEIEDPFLNDPELEAKLNANKKESKDLDMMIKEFTRKCNNTDNPDDDEDEVEQEESEMEEDESESEVEKEAENNVPNPSISPEKVEAKAGPSRGQTDLPVPVYKKQPGEKPRILIEISDTEDECSIEPIIKKAKK